MADGFVIADTTGRTEYPAEAMAQLDGLDVTIRPASFRDERELIARCEAADVIMVTAAPMTRKVLERLPRCRAIVRYGVGLDNIDLQAAQELGVVVSNTRDFCTDEMADHALALILALARGLVAGSLRARSGPWGSSPGQSLRRLRGKVCGIIGLGEIGLALAQRVRAVGMELIGHDPYVTPQAVRTVSLDELLGQADIVSVHCPLTEQTRHLLGERELRLMKRTALLINTARGGIVDEEALVRALEAGEIAGAGLDVLEREPPDPDNPLLHMENVVVTPHMGWDSAEARHDLMVNAFGRVAEILRGAPQGDCLQSQ